MDLISISFSCGMELFTIQWCYPDSGWSPKRSTAPGFITPSFQIEMLSVNLLEVSGNFAEMM